MTGEPDPIVNLLAGLKVRHVLVGIASFAGFIAALNYGASGYHSMGLPVPATRDYVIAQLNTVEENVGVLAESLRQTQQLVLSDKWWRLQEKIDELQEEYDGAPTRPLRDQIRRLARDQACLLYTSPSPRDQRGSRMPSSA